MLRDHIHDGFHLSEPDPFARGSDTALICHLVGASYDGCQPCQDELAAAVAEDAPTTARIVELACVGMAATTGGGLPAVMLSAGDEPMFSPQFRELARAGADADDGNAKLWAAANDMDVIDRAAVVDDAVILLTGMSVLFGLLGTSSVAAPL